MTIVLGAIEADACAQPVLGTAHAIAELFDASAVALHVRENGASSPRTVATGAGVELRETAGDAIEQIVAAAATPMSPRSYSVRAACTAVPSPAGHTALKARA